MTVARFYPTNYQPHVSPALDPAWNNVPARATLSPFPAQTIASTTSLGAGGVSGVNRCVCQFVGFGTSFAGAITPTDGFGAPGSIGGTVQGQFLAQEVAAGDDLNGQLVVRVVSADGLTQRGVVLAANLSALSNEFATTLTNRAFPRGAAVGPIPINTVTFLKGDLLVVEIGFLTNSTTANSGSVRFNDNTGSDLPIDETTTADLNSWIEFSDIQYQSINLVLAGATM